jgi:hypothetical protein
MVMRPIGEKGRSHMKRQISWFLIGVVILLLGAGATPAAGPPEKAGEKTEEATFAALNPRGLPEPIKVMALSPRLSDLNGKTVYVVNSGKTYADEIFGGVAKLLPERFPGVKVVHTGKKKFYGEDEPELWKEIKERADAVIIGPMD